MTNKHTRELRQLSDVDLARRLQESQDDLLSVRFGLATRQTEDTSRLREVRHQIARIKTIMSERESEE